MKPEVQEKAMAVMRSPESLVIADLTARNERLTHQVAMLIGLDENWQPFKRAVADSGTARETLRRRIKSKDGKPPLVKSREDAHGNVEVEVTDAVRVRLALAPLKK